MKRRILAIIVLYKLASRDSVSYQSLLQSAARLPSETLDLGIVLYDNTPNLAEEHDLPPNVRYIASSSNNGLSTAYNLALQTALDEGYDWLLTLDQDTHLPSDSMALFLDALARIEQHPYVAAVVPKIRASGRIVSPNYFAAGAWPRWFSSTFTGISDKEVYAFNSGSLLRTAALRQVGGYSPWFWLDNSDSYIYRQLGKFGKRVFVAGNLEVDHDFSMLNMRERVSPERYKTILISESAFWDLEMNRLAGVERAAKLIGRLVKHLLRKDDPALRKLTLDAIRTRLFRTRSQRLARWRSLTGEERGLLPTPVDKTIRPKVSVCMASYNGERYVRDQLESILTQLDPGDELIVFDDCATDGTLEIIRQVIREWESKSRSPKIVLALHAKNQGVVATFEDAVRSATGDILFLSDDDDLWDPRKIQRVLETFSTQPEANVVSTGMTLIDENGQPRTDAELTRYRNFTAHFVKNLLHNQYQGSTMAFRSILLRHILPFPKQRLFLHDAWIGGSNTLFCGKTVYIDEPLLHYRRHSQNYSRRLSRWNQSRLRFQLIRAYLKHALHHY